MAEIVVPQLAESITEGTIAQWLKQPGETVSKGDYIIELETDKVNIEVISEFSGVLKETLKTEGDTVNAGETIAIISESNVSSSEEKVVEEKITPEITPIAESFTEPVSNVIASPAARKLARERGIDLQNVAALDPLGRIRKQDVSNYVPEGRSVANTASPAARQTIPAQQTAQTNSNKPVETRRMSRRRATIAKNLVKVQHSAAILTTFNEVDLTAVMNVRKKRKDTFFKEHDVKLGFMSFFTKAVVSALKSYPLLNAEIQENEMVVKKFYDIGIAVSTDEGLVVPVVRGADRLNFAEIEKEISDLALKAREAKLTLSELQGGTFTITNGGTFGSLLSTPILNAPQVGILGMHSIQNRPVALDNGTIEIRPMMYLALSYDHRIVDGKEAVGFLVKVKQLLEDPEKLLLEA
ncbi:2-oxoglutarate dehydrogenase complex dihydrolipoyllysine-residue succinyltransferase [Cytobacillus horneckiae]|uniref:Dihydrolipoyllysine-residue succinyltransferase component of 2-oxoglutarate dehydrogenase complex n=1 Tax=Cytobacillus horneckiae TaxID=549687 RepID=A0A2N0ZE02_9BACI|nr:2-oxoglutarate dehydrogenase complex dihydrolipoyllysine-residue succinyltransferase [Cytobacillus horneckiae]MCM3180842.1 2-oxoglutarate dehydrogenase complex dihydrolipoyllysine-residue succinyltransferase [Cytobacillus horneckiae]MEC1157449.1 2-oxoglutarate dehydrogenase complex dihydrolipoyllysine-residue succinyltransferase [Cytobacillus horneckiae]MED2939399.1 2-oxoglutarate dehydrogenase complex dihydrolipoyllysine-residue succinyltransferase [Cytobacillus horneckiae]PKG27739.1 dihydr